MRLLSFAGDTKANHVSGWDFKNKVILAKSRETFECE
jgi:hypothetical protein